MRITITFLFITLLLVSCQQKRKDDGGKGAEIIKKVVKKAGSAAHEAAVVTFHLDDAEYKSTRNCGMFELQQTQKTSDGEQKGVITNISFSSYVNNKKQPISKQSEAQRKKLKTIHELIQFPFGLNDASVDNYLLNVNYDEKEEKQQTYSVVETTNKTDETYVFWIDKTEKTIAYIAYKDAKNAYFLEAYNNRTIEGIRFVDYKKHSAEKSVDLEELQARFAADELEQEEALVFKNIRVELLDVDCGKAMK